MTRTQLAAIAGLGLFAAVGAVQFYEESLDLEDEALTAALPARPPVRPRPVSVEETIQSYMTGLGQDANAAGRLAAVAGLLDALESPAHSRAAIPPAAAAALIPAALGAFAADAELSPEARDLRKRLGAFIVSRAKGPESRAFALTALAEGPEDLRAAILPHLGDPRGVGGRAVLSKVREIKGAISPELYPRVVRRLGGKGAIPELLELLQSTADWKAVGACAVALQDIGDASVMGPVLERLEQVGLLDKPARLPYISGRLLKGFLETAEGSALRRGIRVVQARPSMTRWAGTALARGLESPDPVTRLSAASAVKRGVVEGHLRSEEAETLLSGRMERETEPVLKAELSSGLESLRGGRAETKQ